MIKGDNLMLLHICRAVLEKPHAKCLHHGHRSVLNHLSFNIHSWRSWCLPGIASGLTGLDLTQEHNDGLFPPELSWRMPDAPQVSSAFSFRLQGQGRSAWSWWFTLHKWKIYEFEQLKCGKTDRNQFQTATVECCFLCSWWISFVCFV